MTRQLRSVLLVLALFVGAPSCGSGEDGSPGGGADHGAFNDADIAFATVAQLSRWIETKKLTSERLTNIYLERINRLDPKLRSVITLTPDLALRQARAADRELFQRFCKP